MATSSGKTEEKFIKLGYISFWDYLAFFVGMYGTIMSSANLVFRVVAVGLTSPVAAAIAIAGQVLIVGLYVMVMFFPLVARLLTNKLKKSFVTTVEGNKQLVLFLGFWTSLFLCFLDPVNPWVHIPATIMLFFIVVAKARNNY